MLQSYLKIAWRNLVKQKSISLINIFGLATGVASCLIIYLYVHSELTYDNDAINRSQTVRLTSSLASPESNTSLAITPAILASTLQRELPEVEATLRIMQINPNIQLKTDVFKESGFVKTDPTLFRIFRFEFMEGTASGALDKPNSIVLTKEVAKKYFGKEPALGKMIGIDGQNCLVTAVVNDRPANSDIQMRAMLSADFEKDKTWTGDLNYFTFAFFRNRPDFKMLTQKLNEFGKKYAQPELAAAGAPDYHMSLHAEPLSDVHFSQGKLGDTNKGTRQTIYIFSMLAAFILLIALLNYINLYTAKATERAKEVGIRKVSGAGRGQLIRQFLFEAFFFMLISCLVAFGLLTLLLPYVNTILPTKLELNGFQAVAATGTVFLISWLLAGLYPAFVLTSFKPVLVLKGKFQRSGKGLWLRKAVTITQFAIAAALILGTTVIYSQMKFIRNKDLGYNKDQMLAVYMPTDSVYAGAAKAFQNELRNRPEVQGITVGARMTIEGLTIGSTTLENEGKKRQMMVNYFNIDTNYLPLFGIQLKEGRNFSDAYGTDKEQACIVNEAMVRTMGWKKPIGQFIDQGGPVKKRVIGVTRNYIYRSIHNPVEPLILVYNNNPFFNSVTVKIKPNAFPVVQNLFKKHFPALPFDYGFMDDYINKQYTSDRSTMALFNNFTILAIFLSCLGLYGLVALIAVQRAKEIGIRKVLGASLSQLFSLMTKDFVLLVGIGILVALPIGGVLMHNWLGAYAFHIHLTWWMFVLPAVFLLIVTLITVSKEILKSAIQNPSKVLKET